MLAGAGSCALCNSTVLQLPSEDTYVGTHQLGKDVNGEGWGESYKIAQEGD